MKASAFEFRSRFWILLTIYVLGFVAPWDFAWHLDGSGPKTHVWAQLAVLLSKNGLMSIGAAFNVVLAAGILCALVGAWLRTSGSAYLGVDAMSDRQLRGNRVVANGPYRYLRNPLYLGGLFNLLALTLLMPPSGAIFSFVLVTLFYLRLILGEEDFLRSRLGEPYVAYCERVPRLLPSLRPRPLSSYAHPQWLRAVMAEIFMWGTAGSFAILGWRYDAQLLVQCVMVSLGVSLVVQAISMPRQAAE
jgi:protein-S-isoprenylcysteine O-methyltransferase Ste14